MALQVTPVYFKQNMIRNLTRDSHFDDSQAAIKASYSVATSSKQVVGSMSALSWVHGIIEEKESRPTE